MDNRLKNPRFVALSALDRLDKCGSYSNITLDTVLSRSALSASDKALAAKLILGVISRKLTLDYYISRLSSVREDKIEPTVRNIIRLGLYQLIYLDRIPAHAAVNESVAIAPKRAAGFVNALLRAYQRKGESIGLPTDPVLRLSVSESVPEELCERLIAEYGFETAGKIAASYNSEPPLTLRVNTIKTGRDELADRIISNGIEAVYGKLSPDAIIVPGGNVTELPGFEEGLFFVQDEASQVCCRALGAEQGALVLDICAAPGSKSFGAGMTMNNEGRIVSFDLHENKLPLITKEAEKLGLTVIETRAGDGRDFLPEFEEAADRVICDVPCSGFGVVAKKPEIRYKSLSDADKLPQIQTAILENAARYVKRGGVLIYSTCTVLAAENGDVTDAFLAAHPEFIREDFEVCGVNYPGSHQFLPFDGCDGFYICKMRKI